MPTYWEYLTILISRNSSQFVDTQFSSSWQLSLPYHHQHHFQWLRLSPATRVHYHKGCRQGGRPSTAGRFLDDRVVEPPKDRVERHGEQVATHRGAFPFSCKLNLRHDVTVGHSQGMSDKHKYFCLFKNAKDLEVIDARILTSKICHKNTRITRGTCDVGTGSSLDLGNVIGHLPRRDTSLSRVYASNGILLQAEAYRSGDDLGVTVAQGQRTKRTR